METTKQKIFVAVYFHNSVFNKFPSPSFSTFLKKQKKSDCRTLLYTVTEDSFDDSTVTVVNKAEIKQWKLARL